MTDWQYLDFEDVFEDVTRHFVKIATNDYKTEGRYAIVDQSQQFIAGYTDLDLPEQIEQSQFIVFGDHTRVFKFIDFKFFIGADGVKVLQPKIESDTKYLYHLLNSLVIENNGYSRHFKFLKRHQILVPPLAEQKRIAAILDKADEIRRKREQTIAKLDQLAQSIFVEMFGDAATNPKKWPCIKLSELIKTGPQNGLYKPSNDYGSGTFILRIDAFYDGVVTKIDNLKRVRLSENEISLFGLNKEDIVINRVNSLDYLGKSALIPQLKEPTVFESNMMRFAVDVNLLEPLYLVTFLQSKFIKNQILSCAKNAVNQSSINQQDVKGFLVNLPPLSLQKNFVKRKQAIEKLKYENIAALTKQTQLFASLQHQAFTGNL